MKSVFTLAVLFTVAACASGNPSGKTEPSTAIAELRDSLVPSEEVYLIPTSIPNACEVAWETMPPQQRAHWTPERFHTACSSAGYVVRCADGTIEIDGHGKTCSEHGGSAQFLKWVDA